MEPAQAAAELATIRTLMERAALYRRALAPMMLSVGVLGMVVGGIGWLLPVQTTAEFATLWEAGAVAALAAAFVVVRRQSLEAAEPVWTPPTRRVAAALAPALCLGGILPLPLFLGSGSAAASPLGLTLAWMALHGLGLNAAGFFMPRGIRWFGFAFVAASGLLLLSQPWWARHGDPVLVAHGLMTLAFGLGHLAYGIYLRITERPAPSPVPNRR